MWKPPFISALVNEDRCHLNGLAMRDGQPRYVTMFSDHDDASYWRKERTPVGRLMDIEGDRILVEGLLMPHSPRWWQNHVYYCNSGHGTLCRIDPESGAHEDLLTLPGFTRGMAFHGPLMFLGTSRSRRSTAAAQLPLNASHPETVAGLYVIDIERGEILERLEFTGDVNQIYDVGVIHGPTFPDLLHIDDELVSSIFEFPSLGSQTPTEVAT